MRAIWTGALSFGLVNIPVRLFSGSRERGISFHLLHKKDLSPIRFARVCRQDGREIPYNEIVKGYEIEKGEYVTLTDRDFMEANPRKTRTIDIQEFADEKDIDPVYFDRPYYLGAEEGAEKPFSLLREALRKTGRVGIATYVLRNKEHVGAVKPEEKLIVLNQLRFSDEIVQPKGVKGPACRLGAREMSMARKIIDELTVKFDPRRYHDTYTEELEQMIRNKAKGIKPPRLKESKPTRLPDLMEALQKSLGHGARKAA